MDQGSCDAIKHFEDGFVVDTKLIANKLGLLPVALGRESKLCMAYGGVERGEDDEAGRIRLISAIARSWSITLEDTVE